MTNGWGESRVSGKVEENEGRARSELVMMGQGENKGEKGEGK